MIRRLLHYLWPHSALIIAILLTIILLSAVNICLPLLLKTIIDKVFRDRNDYMLPWLLAGVAGAYITRNSLFFVSRYWSVQIGEGLAFDLRRSLFEHIQGLGIEFYRRFKPGKLTSRLMGDVTSIQKFFRDSLGTLGADTLTVCFLLIVMFVYNWPLALIATAVLPLQVFAYYRMRGAIKLTSKAAAEQLSVVHGDLVESFTAAEVVKGFGREDHEAEKFKESIQKTKDAQISQRVYHVRQKIISDLLIGLGYIIVLAYVAHMLINQQVQWDRFMGTFFMFWMCLRLAYTRVGSIISEAAKFQRSLASLERVYAILDIRPAPKEAEPLAKFDGIRGDVEFRNVSFAYQDNTHTILQNLSFTIPAGETLVIAGPSGCGKSTLVNLLLRMFDPSAGSILIDNVDSKRIRLAELRQEIGVAFQECFLFNRTILENILYARPAATQQQIEDAAKKANAHDFICHLQNGYQTVVGQGGVELSRGEKQRITLTRAILKEPKILILDEATASVDPESEQAILKAIEPIMKDRTTLLITHRQEIISRATHLLRLGQAPAYQYLDSSSASPDSAESTQAPQKNHDVT